MTIMTTAATTTGTRILVSITLILITCDAGIGSGDVEGWKMI
jgi:hypothetical protein